MAGVHQKVYGAVCEKWRREDDRLVSHCQKLTGLTADLLGVSHYFACPLPSAVSVSSQYWLLALALYMHCDFYCFKFTILRLKF